jgi:serine protease Do
MKTRIFALLTALTLGVAGIALASHEHATIDPTGSAVAGGGAGVHSRRATSASDGGVTPARAAKLQAVRHRFPAKEKRAGHFRFQPAVHRDGRREREGRIPASFADIAEAVKPAVVNISTKQKVHTRGVPKLGPHQGPFGENDPFSQFFRHFFDQQPHDLERQALGSGVVIDKDGSIVTNAHVVQGADEIVVKFEDETELPAKIVGMDEKTDIALLEVKGASNLKPAVLGNSDPLRVGDWVLAIGNPFGLSETVTAGIVSAKGRVIGEGPYDDFIQTDASINPGNSGGPLVDMHGQVVGINSAILSRSGGNIGIGFAIPINLVHKIIDQLREHGKVVRGWLGVSIQEVTPDIAKSLDLEEAEGALVADVVAGGPAEKAGLKVGDVILKFDGMKVDSAHQLPTLVAGTTIGKEVDVEVLRDGHKKTISVTIGEMPAEQTAASTEKSMGDWGLAVADVTPKIAEHFGLEPGSKGAIITDVDDDSPAGRAGLRAGDLVMRADHKEITSAAELRKALAEASDSGHILLLIQRQGQTFFVALRRET